MISYQEFQNLVLELSTLTGKTPTILGKKPSTDGEMDYALNLYHRELKGHDYGDIIAGFKDKGLRQEVGEKFGAISLNVIEKYVIIHQSKRIDQEKKAKESKEIEERVKEGMSDERRRTLKLIQEGNVGQAIEELAKLE